MFGRKKEDPGIVVLGMSEAELVAVLGRTRKQSSTEDLLASYGTVVGGQRLPSRRFLVYDNKPRGYDTNLVLQDGKVVRVQQTSRRTGEVVRDEGD
ncbi:hypothetical protein K7711_12725 [Nocardia sp. CA2R105]|uniref:hypothetical protein n=1 Tax=Nocardia coffeae TaxID=2873381 RepID=UPI001CA66FDF|nr:hypothetical protein [Nocardia coffeae]MBY8857347.1 hypothetical protein [Nocardia coffeae]